MNIFPEKLAIKMWETLFDKGIGGLLAPIQSRRMHKKQLQNRIETKLAMAQLDRCVKQIRSGEVIFDLDANKLLPLANNKIDQNLKEITSIANPIIKNQALININKDINSTKSALFAEEELFNDNEQVINPKLINEINSDWLSQWIQYTGNVTIEELQLLWGKILAGEIKTPGKFSLRTLQLVSCLTKKEADEISELSQYCIEDNKICREAILKIRANALEYLLKMQEYGLVRGIDNQFGLIYEYASKENDKFINWIEYNNFLLIITATDPNIKLKIPFQSLTQVGKELISLCNFDGATNYNASYLNEIKTLIEKNQCELFVSHPGEWKYINLGQGIEVVNLRNL